MKSLIVLLSIFYVSNAWSESRPNILFIMVDDLGWKDLRCQGNDQMTTPNIDRLAADGARFTDAYSAAPVCSPTRAAAITGLYPARLKITQHGQDRWNFYEGKKWGPGKSVARLDPSYVTIAERLKDAGYETSFIGKWHLSGYQFKGSEKFLPDNQGFDVNIAGNGWGSPGGEGSFFSPYELPNLSPGPDGEYLPYRLADEAVARLKYHRDSNKPFFICLWHYTPHWPIEAPADLYKKYSDKPRPQDVDRYKAMIEGVDIAVGKTLSALDDLGLSDNTLVVFTSDNGHLAGFTSAEPLRQFKGYLYEAGIRVPLIMRWPNRIKRGQVNHTPITTVDFAPTFAEAARVAVERGDFDGESLLDLVTRGGALQREAIYFHYPHYAWHRNNNMGSVIRQGQYKLIHKFENNAYELYNLDADISESKNLISELPRRFQDMKKKLHTWKKTVGAENPRLKSAVPESELQGRKTE